MLGDRARLGRRSGYVLLAAILLADLSLGGLLGARLLGSREDVAATDAPTGIVAVDTPPVRRPALSLLADPTPPAPVPAAATATGTSAPSPVVMATPIPATPTAVPPTATLTAAQATPRGTTIIPILMYHYVRVVTDPTDRIGINLSVKPDLFAQQMQYLATNGYTTLTMGDVYAILAGQQPLPPRPIALTFDDGYRDFYTAAWPVLRAHNFKATSYVITDFIGNDRYMTWAMLKELDASGLVEIGAHTLDHGDLKAQSPTRRWQEIAESKATLERGLGHPVTAFCYPAGKYNADVIALVRKAGYLTATTVEYGAKQNLQWAYELPRIRVTGPDPLSVWIAALPK